MTFDEQNQPLFKRKRADLGKYQGILDIRHKCKGLD